MSDHRCNRTKRSLTHKRHTKSKTKVLTRTVVSTSLPFAFFQQSHAHETMTPIKTLLLVLSMLVGGQAAAFVKYDGIDGESKDSNHDKWIDVLSIDWGASMPVPPPQRQRVRRRAGPVLRDMTLTLEYDKASPKLQEKCLKGEIIPKLEIEHTTSPGDLVGGKPQTYLKYELTNVLVTSFDINASGNDEAGPPTVIMSNNFEEIKVTYTEFDRTGGDMGKVEYEWKVEEGES